MVVLLLLYPYIPFVYLLAYHASYRQRGAPYLALYQVVVFHYLLALSLWSYFDTYMTLPGSPHRNTVGAQHPLLAEEDEADEEQAIGLRELPMTLSTADEASQRLLGKPEQDQQRLQPIMSSVMAKATTGGTRFCRKCNVA